MKRVQVILVVSMALLLVNYAAGRSLAGMRQPDVPSSEKPLPPEKNPTGDIPDSQVFIKFTSSTGGYVLQVPEGWARKTSGMNVSFTEKLDGLSVTIVHQSHVPDLESVRTEQAAELRRTVRAVTIKGIGEIKRESGMAVLLSFECNSEPGPVTNKQVRLENNLYFYYQNGKLAELRLWAPVGADNVDQWNLISNSFRWR